MKERLVLTHNDSISIVAQDKDLGDAIYFAKSRSDAQTLNQIGAYGNTYDADKVAYYMPEPSLEIANKKIFTIISNEDGRYLGDIRLVRLEDTDEFELGIVIIEGERNKGYGSQAIQLLAEYVFEQLHRPVVFLRVYQNNPRAKGLYLRLGFKYLKSVNDGYVVDGQSYLEDWLVLHK